MKNTIKLSMLALGAAMVAPMAHAQGPTVNGDLLLGVVSSANDFVVDVGQVPTSANTSLGSFDLSSFGASALSAGVVGGDNSGSIDSNGGQTLFTTTVRAGTAPTTYSSAGTEGAPKTSGSTPTSIGTAVNSVYSTAQGSYGVTTADETAWSQNIAASSTQVGSLTPNLASQIHNPMASLATTPVTLDLWSATDDNSVNHYTYIGDIELTESGSTLSAVFDPVAVPEPSTYGLLAGVGLLALAFRRQFVRQNA